MIPEICLMQLPEETVTQKPLFSLTGNQLKILACIAMFADHSAKAWAIRGMSRLLMAQVLGRIAFPIYCFFIAEGFFHTRSRRNYILRMALFAAISEIPYNLALHRSISYPAVQNTLCSLTLGLLLFSCLSYVESFRTMRIELSWILRLLLVAGFAVAAHYLHVDYHERGLLCMAVMYFLRNQRPYSVPVLWACLPLNMNNFSNPGSFLSAFPLHFYRGERGTAKLKYFFYLYYPLHLVIIFLIKHFVLHLR